LAPCGKAFLIVVHGSMDIGGSLLVCGDTSYCPGPYPTSACPEFHIRYRLGRELFTLHTYLFVFQNMMSFFLISLFYFLQTFTATKV
jgi:hypothetical protein